MKRSVITFIILSAVLSLTSCVFEDEYSNPYKYFGAKVFAENTCRFILESAVNAMEQNADGEDNFKEGTVTVQDQRYSVSVEVGKVDGADSTWVVRGVLPYKTPGWEYVFSFNPNKLHYILTLRLLKDKAGDGMHNWNASFTGEYDEGDGYTANLKSKNEGVRMFWRKTDGNGAAQYSLTGDGTCEVEVLKDGKQIDKAYFYYRASQ